MRRKKVTKRQVKQTMLLKSKIALFQLTILLVVTLVVLLIVGGGVGFLIKSNLEEVATGKAQSSVLFKIIT